MLCYEHKGIREFDTVTVCGVMCDGVYIVNDGLEKTMQGDRTHTEIPGFCLASRSFIILSIFPTNAVKNKLMSSINIASNLQEFIDCIAYE